MVEFTNLQITERFRYLWFKYISGVDLNQHCAKTFIGEYSKLINPRTTETSIIFNEFEGFEIFYLCGVHVTFDWNKNFHLAMIAAPGESFEVDELGINMTVTGAKRIPITTDAMEKLNHPKIANKSFSTCRNWQFANFIRVEKITNSRIDNNFPLNQNTLRNQ